MIEAYQKFELKQKSLIEKLTIKAPFRLETQFQNDACYIYFLKGRGKMFSALEQETVETEESVLLRCGTYIAELLQYTSDEKIEIIVFHLYPDILREIYADSIPSFVQPNQHSEFIRKISSTRIIQKFIESLLFYFENKELVSEELLALKIKELVLLLIQTKNADSVLSLFAGLFTPRNLNVQEVVNAHLFSNISVEEMARMSNQSLSTFNRSFQTIFKDTPANYIKAKRLEKAKELLAISSLSVSEIAFQTSFKDLAHFSRSFKKAYALAPSDFRSSLK